MNNIFFNTQRRHINIGTKNKKTITANPILRYIYKLIFTNHCNGTIQKTRLLIIIIIPIKNIHTIYIIEINYIYTTKKAQRAVKPRKIKRRHIKAIIFSKFDLHAFLSKYNYIDTGIHTLREENSI